MKKSCVLVSGGAGYIGSHTSVELINAGYDVVIVDNLSNSDLNAVEGVRKITGVDIPFVEVNCCDRAAFRKVFEQYEFDSVIHFAASKAVGESVQKPLEYYGNNLTSFMNVIGLMREFGRRNIVFSSSCTVYGEPEKQPVTEQTPRKPATSPYGNTKQMCEDILRDSLAAYPGMKGIALRYFNPIGAHPSALIGELPRGVPQNLVPFITQTAEQAGLRDFQRRHGPRRLGAGTGAQVRGGQPPEAQLQDRTAPCGRHHRHLGRSHAGEHRTGLDCRAHARPDARRRLGLGEAHSGN